MSERRKLRRASRILTRGGDAPVRRNLKELAQATCERAREWLSTDGVQGIGIARRTTDGEARGRLALKIYVDRKLPDSACERPVPRHLRIPGMDRRVRTDVEEIGRIRLHANTSRRRPVVPGFSIGHASVPYGTLGCLVTRADDPDGRYVLSNSHVLADSGRASVGDAIDQPGVADQGSHPAGFRIAQLVEWLPLQAGDGFPNRADAAIARVRDGVRVSSSIRLIGVPRGDSAFLSEGMEVRKTGRTSDLTVGTVRDIDLKLWVEYPQGRLGFSRQVLVRGAGTFSREGDSGAVVLNRRDRVVGLHFAGSDTHGIFNRISHVLGPLGVAIVARSN